MRFAARLLTPTIIGLQLLSVPPATAAGPYTDQLANCLISSVTEDDTTALVQWMFASLSLHPAVAEMVQITDQDRAQLNATAASVFQTLLVESCSSQAREAIRNEGLSSLETSFGLFGGTIGGEIASNARVLQGLSEIENYLDIDPIVEALMEE
ncbi:hypothetical protein PN498_07225 [Oscillatoria sp. CS-180]|uniref:hypothetical protein n=1 Tax=Oscillatoria sp. CS-180 TaxID=3021720 RepID=UPI00233126B6|nr:hypothetical protein [Oscillatoria sp. CS-180]MDB9525773.1 hypothetical protein [Oscillatoria sp. CS-180]